MDNPAIEKAYEAAGGRQKVRESLQVSKQSLSDWKRWGYVPARQAAKLEAISKVSRRELCPDFDWGPEVDPQPAPQPRKKARA